MYFITQGKAKIVVNGKTVDLKTKGSFFGEIALLSPIMKRTADVIAEDYCFVEVLTRRSLNDLEKRFVGISDRVKKGLV